MMHWARWSATVAVAALVAAPLCGQGSGGAAEPSPIAPPHAVVTNDMLTNAAASGDWLMYGHNYWNNRFSPLKTINTTNVKNLVPRAVYTHGSDRLGSFETTPIRSEEHTSELQSQSNLVCRLLLEKKKKNQDH